LRPDKSVVSSPTGKAAVSYRVLAGVALACGDPLGDPEARPGAINAHIEVCARHGWVQAVLGCSELGATVWTRHGLHALELGDEAVVDVASFTLDGRAMRGVRQMASRAARAGHQVRVRRADELDPAERDQLASLADRWRGRQPERGFSMALGRLAHHTDPDCVLVTAERDGHVVGVLQFVQWGTDGLSLDLMRRETNAEGAGLNELMITELLTACGPLGIRRVSLNFAAFRAALAQGQRLGAGPFARLSAAALHLGSRWWQIDSLYRFNGKFHPQWTPATSFTPPPGTCPEFVLHPGRVRDQLRDRRARGDRTPVPGSGRAGAGPSAPVRLRGTDRGGALGDRGRDPPRRGLGDARRLRRDRPRRPRSGGGRPRAGRPASRRDRGNRCGRQPHRRVIV
jgi:lysyl-tRNA synthetase class 2